MKKRFKATYSGKYKLWTIWKRTSLGGWIYPIGIAKTLANAWKEAEASQIYLK